MNPWVVPLCWSFTALTWASDAFGQGLPPNACPAGADAGEPCHNSLVHSDGTCTEVSDCRSYPEVCADGGGVTTVYLLCESTPPADDGGTIAAPEPVDAGTAFADAGPSADAGTASTPSGCGQAGEPLGLELWLVAPLLLWKPRFRRRARD